MNNPLIKRLKKIKSIEILNESDKFISIKFDLIDKLRLINAINRLSISIHTQDNLTTATIKL